MPSLAELSLEKTVDQVLEKNRSQLLESLKLSFSESQQQLSDSLPELEKEYERILSEGQKEAEKIEKQIVGSSDLEVRNKALLLVEEHTSMVFEKAKEQIKNTKRDSNYSNLISTLLTEATEALGTSEITVFTNSTDKDIVQSAISKISGADLSSEQIDCMGGVKITSKDGSMTFDNTIDARFERMKPLIRKNIAAKFSLGN
ncbi:MAG: V-type ATP synthase subunit E family protein [Candidatus Nitrosopelagicus sp.]|jgi:V/A-type H+-transporting ATPase subunit E|nr:V-type ATP synthase subunit E family protein [Candidatus Nitrosopelagicus sp.]|tara:strand:+ start:332 stop:937 length:606 start_codon:yes stop_codon:yes gene_type:complete